MGDDFSGSSIASQRLGAGNRDKAIATIATYTSWILIVGALLAALFIYGVTLGVQPDETRWPHPRLWHSIYADYLSADDCLVF